LPREQPDTVAELHVVILCSGGLEQQSGGVGRLMLYVVDAWRRSGGGPSYRVVDARGPGSIIWSPFHLIKALAQITIATATGRATLLHVNISVRGSAIRKSVIIMAAALLRRPVILHLHDGHFETFYNGLPKPGRALLSKLFGYASKIIVLGQHWRQVVARDLNVPEEHIVMLYNAVPDPSKKINKSRSRGDGGPCNILFLGRLGPWKGVPVLLEALQSPALRKLQWRATLAGDGEVETYQAIARETAISKRLDFPGWVSVDTAEGLLRRADILVLPSQGEGLPMSILEALAHKVAVIATPVGSIPELIEDGKTGLLIPVGDGAALADAIRHLIANPDERARLAAAGRLLFEHELDVDIYARRLADLYTEVAADAASPTPARQPQAN